MQVIYFVQCRGQVFGDNMKDVRFVGVLVIAVLLATQVQALAEQTSEVEEIVIVFKTHFDIGYTDYAESVLQNYSGPMINSALSIMDKTRALPGDKRFVWTLPGWPMHEILKRAEPETTERVEEAIRNGWFAVHGLPFTFHTEASGLEDLVRGLWFSAEISRRYGLPLPEDAKMTDVPSHSWVIPTLLQHAGIKFLHLGCNPASPSPEVPLLFWWEGPDGSRVMTMYWGKYYGTDLVPPSDWPHKTWLAIIHTNDNQGAPTPAEVGRVLQEAKERAPNAEVRIGRMSDFYDALIKESPALPVIRGDMPDTWIHGVMSMPKEVKAIRKTRDDVFALESLSALLNIWSAKQPDVSSKIADVYEQMLLFDEHTFGLAMSHGHSGTWHYGDQFQVQKARGVYRAIEHSWKEKGDRVWQAERIAAPTLRQTLHNLALQVNVPGQRVVVYNPLPWKRTGLVTVLSGSEIKALKDLRTGDILPVTHGGNVLQFLAREVPPLGYCTFIPSKTLAQGKEEGLFLDNKRHVMGNEHLEITLDPIKGTIASLVDKRTGKSMVNQTSQYGFGQYVYERFSKKMTDQYAKDYIKGGWNWANAELGRPGLDDTPYKVASGTRPRILYTKTATAVQAQLLFSVTPDMPHAYSMTITLNKEQPSVDLTWSILGKSPEPWPEGGWISFNFNVTDPVFRLGRLGAVVDPTRDYVKGTNQDYSFLSTGMAVVDRQGQGMGVCSPDAPAVSLDRPGLWKYSQGFEPQRANVFFNLYNNQWSTNFTEWIEGSWSARFRVWPIRHYSHEHSIVTPSEENRVPLYTALVSGAVGALPSEQTGLSLSRKGVLVTAFGPNPNGQGTVLRLWEQAGQSGPCVIQLPEGVDVQSIQPIDLRGRALGKMTPVQDGRFSIEVQAFAPASFLLKNDD